MKKIAVILTNGHSEGIRMVAGLSLLDDKVDVYLLEKNFGTVDLPVVEKYLELVRAVGIGLYLNFIKEGFDFISNKDLGKKILDYDYAIPY